MTRAKTAGEAHACRPRCSAAGSRAVSRVCRRGAITAVLCCMLLGGAMASTPERSRDAEARREREKGGLGKRLIREATGVREDVMDTVVRLMGESARSLEIEYDAGPETQAVQQEIVDQLENAIKKAAAQRRPIRPSRQRPRGDRRRMPRSGPEGNQHAEPSASSASAQAESGTVDAAGNPVAPDGSGGALIETRSGWGHLPPRERDELIQGSEEAFLEQYRAWIELYYKALQEAD